MLCPCFFVRYEACTFCVTHPCNICPNLIFFDFKSKTEKLCSLGCLRDCITFCEDRKHFLNIAPNA